MFTGRFLTLMLGQKLGENVYFLAQDTHATLICIFGKNFSKYILPEGPHDNMDQEL